MALWGALAQGPAHAHGGAQESVQVLPQAGPPVVRTTYGILRPVDNQDWRWTCEEVAGSLGITTYAITELGTQLIGNFDGMHRSEDGCDWALSGGDLDGDFVTDIFVHGATIYATTGLAGGENHLYLSTDDGLSFTSTLGEGVDTQFRSVVADGDTTWLAGWTAGEPWARPVGADEGEGFFAHGEDPVSSIGLMAMGAEGQGWVRLLRESGAELWEISAAGEPRLALATTHDIDGLILDGAHLIVGSREDGAHQSLDGGFSWMAHEAATLPDMGCLALDDGLVFTCADNWRDGAGAMSAPLTDAPLDTWSWSPVLWYGDVHGPEDCPEGTANAETCAALWAEVAPSGGYDLPRSEDTGGAPAPEGCTGCAQSRPPSLLWLLGLLALRWRARGGSAGPGLGARGT